MPSLKEQINKAIITLQKGGVIVFPTETLYGLGCDATNTRAIKRVNAIKGREDKKTPPLIVADLKMAERYADIPPLLKQIARRYWPGPLTLVVPAKPGSGLSSHVIRNGEIALRVTSNEVARTLSKKQNTPLVATSANKAGELGCSSVRCVKQSFKTQQLQPDTIIDAKALPKRKPSTIIKEHEGKIQVLRQGSIRIPKNYVS